MLINYLFGLMRHYYMLHRLNAPTRTQAATLPAFIVRLVGLLLAGHAPKTVSWQESIHILCRVLK